MCSLIPSAKLPRPSKLLGLRPRKSRTRGNATVTSRSMNSYIRVRRRVTLPPIAKRRGHLLGIVHRLADAHVEHDLVDARHFHLVRIAELLDQFRPHRLAVE